MRNGGRIATGWLTGRMLTSGVMATGISAPAEAPEPKDSDSLDWLTATSASIERKNLFSPLANPPRQGPAPALPIVAAGAERDRRSRLCLGFPFLRVWRRSANDRNQPMTESASDRQQQVFHSQSA
jgi:hypothetical protein